MGPYLKAITGAIIAGLTALIVSLDDDVISQQEWLKALVAFFAALVVVWAVPNVSRRI